MQTPTTLYKKFGGQQAVKQVVDDFYNDVLADDTVNHFFVFAHTDMEKPRSHKTAFISYALGGLGQYSGP